MTALEPQSPEVQLYIVLMVIMLVLGIFLLSYAYHALYRDYAASFLQKSAGIAGFLLLWMGAGSGVIYVVESLPFILYVLLLLICAATVCVVVHLLAARFWDPRYKRRVIDPPTMESST